MHLGTQAVQSICKSECIIPYSSKRDISMEERRRGYSELIYKTMQ